MRWALFSVLVSVLILGLTTQAYAPSHPEYVGFEHPHKQMMYVVQPEAVKCNQGLELIIKHDQSPACVKPATAEKLQARGWGVIPPPCCKDMPNEVSQIEDIPLVACSGTARCFTGTVNQVIDGDTIKVDGQSIRFALASTPELTQVGGMDARSFIADICPVGSEAFVDEDDLQTEGSYGRIIGVIHCNGVNLNKAVLDEGLGYLSSGFCSSSEFATQSWAQKYGCSALNVPMQPKEESPPQVNCDPSYPDVCIASSPPDLNCGDISHRDFRVVGSDPHRFDGDGDGIGCES